MRRLNFKFTILFLALPVLLATCKSLSEPRSNQTTNIITNISDTQSSDKQLIIFDGEIGGCGDIFVYRATKDKTKVISVRADKDTLKLSAKPQTFDIESNSYLEVYIDDFGKSEYTGYRGYCVDLIIVGRPEPVRTKVVKGKVTIYFSKNPKSSDTDFPRVTVDLENISIQNSNSNLTSIRKIEIKDVKVGWLLG